MITSFEKTTLYKGYQWVAFFYDHFSDLYQTLKLVAFKWLELD